MALTGPLTSDLPVFPARPTEIAGSIIVCVKSNPPRGRPGIGYPGRMPGAPLRNLVTDAVENDPSANSTLFPLMYAELRRLAHYYLSRERGGHTLQATALVH